MIETLTQDFTPEKLLSLAIAFSEQGGYEGRKWASYAELCAEYMESRNIKSAKYIGPFGDPGIQKGDRVRITKDSCITGTGGPKHARKSYEIKVFDVSDGCVYLDDDGKIVCRSPEVCWVRSGGYWGYVSARDVEKV